MNDIIEIIAKELAAKNKIVTFNQGSIFESLSSSIATPEDLNAVCKAISGKLVNEVTLIKTKMIPFMVNVVAVIDSKIKKYQPDSEAAKYKIEEFDIPAIVNELKNRNEVTLKRPVREYGIAVLSIPTPTENIKELFTQEHPILNSLGQQVVNKYSDEYLTNLWDKYLSNISKSNINLNKLPFNLLLSMDDLVLLYLLVVNLKDNKPSGVPSSDSVYKDIMNHFYLEILNYFAMALDTLETYRRLNRLVIDIKDKYTIVVDKKVLNEVVDSSFNVEILLGMLVRGNLSASEMLYPNIVVNADKFRAEWNNLVKLDRMSIKQKESSMFGTLYHLVLKDVYEKMIPKDLEEFVVYDLVKATEVLEYKLSILPLSDITNTNYMAREIVAHMVFPTSNFHKFTDYMIEYSKLDDSLTQTEAAGFAVIDILLDYLTGQLTTKDING